MARSRRRELGRREVKEPTKTPLSLENHLFPLHDDEHVGQLDWAGVGTFHWLPTAQERRPPLFDDTHPTQNTPRMADLTSPLRYAFELHNLTSYLPLRL